MHNQSVLNTCTHTACEHVNFLLTTTAVYQRNFVDKNSLTEPCPCHFLCVFTSKQRTMSGKSIISSMTWFDLYPESSLPITLKCDSVPKNPLFRCELEQIQLDKKNARFEIHWFKSHERQPISSFRPLSPLVNLMTVVLCLWQNVSNVQ